MALFLVAGLIGAALKTVAEEDQNLHQVSHELMIAGLIVLTFAVWADNSL